MHAVILATQKQFYPGKIWPEAMQFIADRPKLEYVLEQLPKGAKKIIFILGYRGDIIKRYFGDSWQGRELRYLRQYHLTESLPGTLHRARKILRNDKFVIVESETFEIKNV